MHILITGGCGFVGARLARTLLAQGQLCIAGAVPQAIRTITLSDRAEPPADLAADARVKFVGGDLNELIAKGQLPLKDAQVIYHLAAAVSGECEADFDLGMRSNLDATLGLLQACRHAGHQPTVVFSSSLAVFGGSAEQPMPAVIEDHTLPTPQGSYGIQKFIGEQLVADFARKGFIRGRNVRLMTVSVRPGRPNGAASGFLSGMIREPLAGVRAVVPVAPDTPVALASPRITIDGLIRAVQASDAEWGPRTALNFPSITCTVRQMADALHAVAGDAGTALLDWKPDPAIEKLVYSWPGRVNAVRAAGLGLRPDASFEAIVREYVRENPAAIKIPVKG